MEWTKETVKVHVGKWVHCHSVYGMHHAVLHRALHDGIILVNVTHLASQEGKEQPALEYGTYQPDQGDDLTQVVLIPPGAGLFVPYPGLFGLWPAPGFII